MATLTQNKGEAFYFHDRAACIFHLILFERPVFWTISGNCRWPQRNSHSSLVSCLRSQQSVAQESHLRRAQIAPCGREGHFVRLGPVPQVFLMTIAFTLTWRSRYFKMKLFFFFLHMLQKNICVGHWILLPSVDRHLLLFCNDDALHN